MGSDLVHGLSALLTPETIGLLVLGMVVGMFVGMLPGLGVVLVLTLMLPFVYHLGVLPAIAMMLATQAGSYFAASITAILINTPGSPESFPTTLDGFPMARRGEAGRALAVSATSTWLGGWIACAAFLGLIRAATQFNSLFKPPEFVTIIILALVLIGNTGRAAISKVILSGAIGFMLSFVGSDAVTGVDRFTFGAVTLFNGISVIPFALGVFAITQMVTMYGARESVTRYDGKVLASQFREQVPAGIRDTFRNWPVLVRSGLIGSVLGLVPGLGGFTANFIAYGVGRRLSRKGDQFGTGIPEGVIAAEGSSLAKEVGSIVPAVALGLPSGLGMVIFLAALTILGLQPGIELLAVQPSLPYSMMWVMAITVLLSCVVGLAIAPWLSRVTAIRGPLMLAVIVPLAMLGSFAALTSNTGMVEVVVFAVVGVVMRKLNYSVAAIAIGLVLGATFDDNVHLTQSIYGWGFLSASPLADVFIAVTILLLLSAALRGRRARRQSAETAAGVSVAREVAAEESAAAEHVLLAPIVDVVIIGLSIAYLVIALGYPPAAGLLPAAVAALVVVTAGMRLAIDAGALARSRRAHPLRAGPPLDSEVPAAAARSTRESNVRELAALAWVAAFFVGAYLFGFRYGLAAVAVLYVLFGVEFERRWSKIAFTIGAGLAVFGIADAFLQLFHFTETGIV